MTDVRFPIGKFNWEGDSSPARREQFINDLGELPARLREVVTGLTDEQLDTPYRDGGWSVRQVVHHVADSHLNSYVRFRLTLTEETPTIKAYDEAQWAELEDARRAPVEVSLALIESLHDRWVRLLRSLQPEDFAREFKHPERGNLSLDANLALYSWHGQHHTAHINNLRERMGWK
jgi:uncharacterized damage-inducible protein DinB